MMKLSPPFHWGSVTMEDVGQVIDLVLALDVAPEKQRELVEAFCALGPKARENVGYISGYYGEEKATRILNAFKTEHPIFGTNRPTPEEAFKLGQELGKKMQR